MITNEKVDDEILDRVIQNLVKKAIAEMKNQIIYCQLCKEMIRLELQLRDLAPTSHQKHSSFRVHLINVCKYQFDESTSKEERIKHEGDNMEAMSKLKNRMLGTIHFVGELFRINLLYHSAISQIFTDLMGTNPDGEYQANSEIDDLKIEGSVSLMNQIGENLEKILAKTKMK
eukprot:CAMPEP_0170483996 /NCGR_PEP_ID=MMETSP0208-20121228/3552_1 /TAXON_ID=197538 /ORGANISM="Strombidium inclinatum, Strain S3" /LENGTH=172 /DNA_ID=CAMNT_0010757213 /DNA_START=533 /DNA_END=1051 /DNA_ORIENTATION=-